MASFWKTVGEALHGSRQDYTEGSVGRSILLLAIPMVLEVVLESVFAITDVFFVARLGEDAIATVGLTESMMTIVFAFGIGVSMSTTAMVARRIGEKDTRGAATAGVQAIFLGIGLSIILGVPAFLLAPRLLAFMGATPQLVSVGQNYTAIVLGAMAIYFATAFALGGADLGMIRRNVRRGGATGADVTE